MPMPGLREGGRVLGAQAPGLCYRPRSTSQSTRSRATERLFFINANRRAHPSRPSESKQARVTKAKPEDSLPHSLRGPRGCEGGSQGSPSTSSPEVTVGPHCSFPMTQTQPPVEISTVCQGRLPRPLSWPLTEVTKLSGGLPEARGVSRQSEAHPESTQPRAASSGQGATGRWCLSSSVRHRR